MKVKKAIIPAAGLGTRFLPATKAQPKEMLPIVDKPTIQYIVEEAVKSGIEDIIIVTGRGKRAIEDHFDKSYELEEELAKKEKWELLQEVQQITKLADIHYIRQKEPKGLGHAIYCAKTFVGSEPFAVMLGDDIVQSETPSLFQLIQVFEKYNSPIVGVQEVSNQDVHRYGVVDFKVPPVEKDVFEIIDLVEKPTFEQAPSKSAIMGRYILTPDIFGVLEDLKPGIGGEIQLTDAIKALLKYRKAYAYHFSGKRYDVGDKLGFIKATIDFGLRCEDINVELLKYLKQTIQEITKH